MDDQYLTFDESSFSTEHVEKDFSLFSISNLDEEKPVTFELTTTKSRLRRFIDYYNKKENLYIKAIKNLLIQNNFLELALQLEEGYISEEEYNRKIEKYPGKYVVQVDNLDEPNDVKVIQDIMKKMGNKYSVEEVAELFSLDEEDLEDKMLALEND